MERENNIFNVFELLETILKAIIWFLLIAILYQAITLSQVWMIKFFSITNILNDFIKLSLATLLGYFVWNFYYRWINNSAIKNESIWRKHIIFLVIIIIWTIFSYNLSHYFNILPLSFCVWILVELIFSLIINRMYLTHLNYFFSVYDEKSVKWNIIYMSGVIFFLIIFACLIATIQSWIQIFNQKEYENLYVQNEKVQYMNDKYIFLQNKILKNWENIVFETK